MTSQLTFEDILGCQAALFEWAESYDTKDWQRLSRCIAPTLRIDYRAFLNKLWPSMPAADFLAMASDPHVLGNPRLCTQHLVGGASRWEKTSDTEITGYHQMRVAHQRYADDARTEVAVKGHAHGKGTVWYRKVDGEGWKFAGIQPDIRWGEYDHDKVFEHGEEKFGEKEGEGKAEEEGQTDGE
ncbi:scytalone dehydratase [Chaetomium sp. MPI-SDFR-AT-0129]|nr:scytalone dehydratase [Chaetomium sp. MPI-SDFR-AT-0129]